MSTIARRSGVACGLLCAVALGGATAALGAPAAAQDGTLTGYANSQAAAVSKVLDRRRTFRVTVTGTIGVQAGAQGGYDAIRCFRPAPGKPGANQRVDREGQSIARLGACGTTTFPAYAASHCYSALVTGERRARSEGWQRERPGRRSSGRPRTEKPASRAGFRSSAAPGSNR